MKLYPDDWQVRLTSGAVVAACMLAAIFLGPVVGIHGFWPFMLSIVVASFVGTVLGGQVARLLFPPSSVDPPDLPPRA
jgi:hypothetical protein